MSPQTPRPTGAPPALHGRTLWLLLIALLLGMLLAALDQTIVATALPTIVGDLGSASRLSWIVTAYLLASTASTPLSGKLGDMYGRKLFFQAAIVIFLVGSALAGLSQSIGELIAFRAIQGIGGGGLMIGAQTIVGDVVSPADRGRYQGLFGAVFGVTSVLGPLVGGLLVDHASWRWVFYVNLPVGVVALLVTGAFLPGAQRRVRHVIDYLGAALLALATTSLVLMTSLGGTTYAWGSVPMTRRTSAALPSQFRSSRHENASRRVRPGSGLRSDDPGQGPSLGERRRVGRFWRWASSPCLSLGRPCDLPGLSG